MVEQWKPVPGYDGLYEVSDHGNVRSLERITTDTNGRRTRMFRGKLLPGYVLPIGYRVFQLSSHDKTKSLQYAHRLVLLAFRGPAPEQHEGCHEDGDSLNNRLDNLRWDTRSGNVQDSIRHGTHWASNQNKDRKKEAKA